MEALSGGIFLKKRGEKGSEAEQKGAKFVTKVEKRVIK